MHSGINTEKCGRPKPTAWWTASVLAVSLVYSYMTVSMHVDRLGLNYLERGIQIERHRAVLENAAKDPWQYRLMSEYITEAGIRVAKALDIHNPHATAFVFTRYAQGLLIFLACFLYYTMLGLPRAHTVVAVTLLALGMSNADYGSDLQFNTYFDVLFYLVAAMVILTGRYVWIVPLSAIAALNRETAGLIPFMAAAVCLWKRRTEGWSERDAGRRMVISAGALGVFLLVLVGVRLALGPRELFIPYGHEPGLALLKYNLFRRVTWVRLLATLGVTPLLAAVAEARRRLPVELRAWVWAVVPIWILVHAFMSVMAETRLFLVPFALVFIPGAMFLLKPAETETVG